MKRIFLLSLIVGITNSAISQIQPPGLQCVSGETLQWTLPNNPCGPFQNYQLWFSTDPTGPFTNLATITDPAQTTFVHTNPSNLVYYYYMYTEADCPGEPTLFSDTITNNNPSPAPITHVTVENGLVNVFWEPSITDPLQGYIIYRQIGINVDPIDTVFITPGMTFMYEDLASQPGSGSEEYYVLALDDCGNTSIFLEPHNTIFLDGEVSVCDREIQLDWNIYESWTNGVDFQELVMTSDGINFTTFELSDTVDLYNIDGLEQGVQYCFYLEGVEANTGIRSRSNVKCLVYEISVPLQDYAITGVGFTEDEEVQVDWIWNVEADLSNYVVRKKIVGTSDVEVMGPFDASGTLSFENTYFDEFASTEVGPWEYGLEIEDECGGRTDAGVSGRTIFLQGEALPDGSNQLNWTAMRLTDTEILTYEIYKEGLSGFVYLDAVDASTVNYTDPFDPIYKDQSDIQYYVVGRGSLTLPDSVTTQLAESRSNTIALDQRAVITAPNVFAPGGLNSIFQPFILHSENTQFHMQVFNRWGGKVFESRDLNFGWDGTTDGQSCPQGVYVYFIRLVQANGKEIIHEGNVLLLR